MMFFVVHLRVYSIVGYAAVLIGASALASWNEQFPSTSLQALWRVISIASAALPIAVLAVLILYNSFRNTKYEKILDRTTYFMVVMHGLVRIILIVLLFYSFRRLPSGVYDTQDWLDFIPFFH